MSKYTQPETAVCSRTKGDH